MMFYNVCGLVIGSNIPLSELLPVASKKSVCDFQFLPLTNYSFASHHWIHNWQLPDGKTWLRVAKTEAGFVLHFPAFADFFLSPDAKNIQCYPAEDTPLETIRHLLLDQVIPLVLNHQGKLVLHAGAVVLPEGAVAFLGASGFGKSTLTASFSQQGFPLLTDDCVLLEEKDGQILVVPSYPSLRLWPENAAALLADEVRLSDVTHYSSKKRLGWVTGQLNFTNDAVPLRRLYLLANPEEQTDSSEIQITLLSPRNAFIEVLRHTFHLDVTDMQRLAREMSELSHLVTLGLVYKLSYPRELALLPKVQEMILNDVKSQ